GVLAAGICDNRLNVSEGIKKPCRSRVLSVIVRIRQKPAERSVISDVCAASSASIPALYSGYAEPHFPIFPADYAALPDTYRPAVPSTEPGCHGTAHIRVPAPATTCLSAPTTPVFPVPA